MEKRLVVGVSHFGGACKRYGIEWVESREYGGVHSWCTSLWSTRHTAHQCKSTSHTGTLASLFVHYYEVRILHTCSWALNGWKVRSIRSTEQIHTGMRGITSAYLYL